MLVFIGSCSSVVSLACDTEETPEQDPEFAVYQEFMAFQEFQQQFYPAASDFTQPGEQPHSVVK